MTQQVLEGIGFGVILLAIGLIGWTSEKSRLGAVIWGVLGLIAIGLALASAAHIVRL